MNAEAKKVSTDAPKACIVASLLDIRGKDLDIVDSPEGKLAVVPVFVVAVRTPMGLIPMEETVWFTLLEPQGKGV